MGQLHQPHAVAGVGGQVHAAHAAAAQGALEGPQAAFHVGGGADDLLHVAGALLQPLQGLLHALQLGLEGHRRVRHPVEGRLGAGDGLAEGQGPLLHRLQQVSQVGQVAPEHPGVGIELVLALGDGAPGGVQPVQPAGGGVKAVLHLVQRVQKGIQAAGQGPVVLLQVVLALAQLGYFLQLGQGGGHHENGHAVKGKVVAAHPDGEVALLPGQTHEQHGAQVAHQLDLGPLGLQRQNVILVEQGHGLQGVVVPGVAAGPRVGDDVQQDLHHPLLPGQLLRPSGHTVEGVPQGDGPGQRLEGFLRLALEVEMTGGLFKLKGRPPLPQRHRSAVGEVDHLVVDPVVGELPGPVEGVAFYHTAIQQVAVVVQGGVIGLVIGGGHAVLNGGRPRRNHAGGRRQPSQRQRQGSFFVVVSRHKSFLLIKSPGSCSPAARSLIASDFNQSAHSVQ